VNDGAVMTCGLNDAITFQQAIRFRHRLVVKILVVGKLSDRGERVAREQLVAEHGSFYLPHQLSDQGDCVVDLDDYFH
jgi:hypothetical protein